MLKEVCNFYASFTFLLRSPDRYTPVVLYFLLHSQKGKSVWTSLFGYCFFDSTQPYNAHSKDIAFLLALCQLKVKSKSKKTKKIFVYFSSGGKVGGEQVV